MYSPTHFTPVATILDWRLNYSSNEGCQSKAIIGFIRVPSTYLQDDSIPDCSFAKKIENNKTVAVKPHTLANIQIIAKIY